MTHITVLTGSTRPGRFNTQVAEWVHAQSKEYIAANSITDTEFELVDIADLDLPLYDEPVPAQSGQYDKEHTKAWSKIVDRSDGFIVVAPEYNHSIPGALKNAFDYLYNEWVHKPITFVSYGSGAGGSRSVEHLRAVAGELRMYDLRDQLLLPNYWTRMTDGSYDFSEDEAVQLAAQLKDIIFWANTMKDARIKLASK